MSGDLLGRRDELGVTALADDASLRTVGLGPGVVRLHDVCTGLGDTARVWTDQTDSTDEAGELEQAKRVRRFQPDEDWDA